MKICDRRLDTADVWRQFQNVPSPIRQWNIWGVYYPGWNGYSACRIYVEAWRLPCVVEHPSVIAMYVACSTHWQDGRNLGGTDPSYIREWGQCLNWEVSSPICHCYWIIPLMQDFGVLWYIKPAEFIVLPKPYRIIDRRKLGRSPGNDRYMWWTPADAFRILQNIIIVLSAFPVCGSSKEWARDFKGYKNKTFPDIDLPRTSGTGWSGDCRSLLVSKLNR